jgi:hypothetical protein
MISPPRARLPFANTLLLGALTMTHCSSGGHPIRVMDTYVIFSINIHYPFLRVPPPLVEHAGPYQVSAMQLPWCTSRLSTQIKHAVHEDMWDMQPKEK